MPGVVQTPRLDLRVKPQVPVTEQQLGHIRGRIGLESEHIRDQLLASPARNQAPESAPGVESDGVSGPERQDAYLVYRLPKLETASVKAMIDGLFAHKPPSARRKESTGTGSK